MPTFTWRRLTEREFRLLQGWLEQPHVARWWNHETSDEAVERDFGAAARGEEPCEDMLIFADGEPVGLIQRYRLVDYPEDRVELAAHINVPADALGIDYLIGNPERVNRGLGTEMIRAFVARSWSDYPDAGCIIVPIVAANRASWRALERAGFHRIAEGDLEPDNPIDNWLHYIYRADRPLADTEI